MATVIHAERHETQTSNIIFKGRALLHNKKEVNVYVKDLVLQELINEILVYIVAKSLNLPVVDSFLGIVDSATLSLKKAPTASKNQSFVFLSKISSAKDMKFHVLSACDKMNKKISEDLLEWLLLGPSLALDAWVANVDRNLGNILYAGPQEFMLIDHGQSFGGPRNWGNADLGAHKEFDCKLSQIVNKFGATQAQRKLLQDKASETKSDIDKLPIATIISKLPAIKGMEDVDVKRMRNFLEQRIQHILRLISHKIRGNELVQYDGYH